MRRTIGIDGINGRILDDSRYSGIPAAGVAFLRRNGRVIAGLQCVAVVHLHGFQRLSIRKEYDSVLRFKRRVYGIDRHIVVNRHSILPPRTAVARFCRNSRIIAIFQNIAVFDRHSFDSRAISLERDGIFRNLCSGANGIGFTRADAVCVVGEIEDVLGRAVALGGRAAELAAVLPLHVPEQLRPVRVKRRVTAAVVLEVDAVDGRQQVAPPFVFVGVLVQLAIASLVVL